MARKVKEPVAAVKASAMSKFANQLRGWRAKQGWSQAELAGQLGYSNALVSQIEQEHKPPSAEFAAKCARYVPIDDSPTDATSTVQTHQ